VSGQPPASRPAARPGRRPAARLLRTVVLALLASLAVGFLIGLLLRARLERPVRYLGRAGSAAPAHPLDLGHPGPAILDARQDEEQVREAVQVAQRGLLQRLRVV